MSPRAAPPPLVSGRRYLYRGQPCQLQRYRRASWLLIFDHAPHPPVYVRNSTLGHDARLGILQPAQEFVSNRFEKEQRP